MRASLVFLLVLVACDPTPAPIDAATDAGSDAMRLDAGPPPRFELPDCDHEPRPASRRSHRAVGSWQTRKGAPCSSAA